jgi:DNA-binding CsgD family transcriptional regulator
MLDYINPSQLLSQLFGLQKDKYPEDAGKSIVLKESHINAFSISEHSVKIIFDHVNMKILHISDNIELITGYSAKDFEHHNLSFVLNFFTLDHYNFLYIWLKWSLSLHAKLKPSELSGLVNVKHAICGVKVKHKDGHIIRILLRHYVLEETENHIPTVATITIDDVTHLIKSDFYWGRIERGVEGKKMYRHFVSTDNENQYHDIISDREKETLRLLAKGLESKEIGKIIYLSSHTIDNHRRNMLAKMGVKDTTALVQICKMVGMI